jgi:hypothetical protein
MWVAKDISIPGCMPSLGRRSLADYDCSLLRQTLKSGPNLMSPVMPKKSWGVPFGSEAPQAPIGSEGGLVGEAQDPHPNLFYILVLLARERRDRAACAGKRAISS